MIIARIIGGLGNQLFSYAAARALSLRMGRELVLDTRTGFQRDTHRRSYALKHFAVAGRAARRWESFDFRGGRQVRAIVRSASRRMPFRWRPYITEDSPYFDPRMTTEPVGRLICMEGYFQSERYFDDHASVIRQDLQVVSPCSLRTLEVGDAIRASNSVSVHLRRLYGVPAGGTTPRGDVPAVGLSYYRNAMKTLAAEVPNAHFFVFADHPVWARENLRVDVPMTFVDHNAGDENAFQDLHLMSLCRHHIVANSTFSWWGAWLSQHDDQIVFAPRMFNFGENDSIIPDRWRVLSRGSDAPQD